MNLSNLDFEDLVGFLKLRTQEIEIYGTCHLHHVIGVWMGIMHYPAEDINDQNATKIVNVLTDAKILKQQDSERYVWV